MTEPTHPIEPARTALVVGGSGGIGRAFVDYLLQADTETRIHATYFKHPPALQSKRVEWHKVDLFDEQDIASLAARVGALDLSINAAGMLHDDRFSPEKSIRQIDADYFIHSMRSNALPTLLLARHLAPNLKHGQRAVFATVSARVGSIEENYLGGWYSYRASKAALNMLLKTLAIEWRRSLPKVVVAALHPGTTDTSLSKPFQKNVPEKQLFSPVTSVAYMMQVIGNLQPRDSGRFWSFDGEQLPW